MIRRTACLIARSSDPFRNQAIEKHLMDTLPEDTAILYLWQNAPTAMPTALSWRGISKRALGTMKVKDKLPLS